MCRTLALDQASCSSSQTQLDIPVMLQRNLAVSTEVLPGFILRLLQGEKGH